MAEDRAAASTVPGEAVKFKLSSPIATHDGMQDTLELKQPKIAAFVKYGAPWKEYVSGPMNDRRSHFEFNYPAVMGFVSEMTGHDLIVLSSIAACDMEPLCMAVTGIVATRNPR